MRWKTGSGKNPAGRGPPHPESVTPLGETYQSYSFIFVTKNCLPPFFILFSFAYKQYVCCK